MIDIDGSQGEGGGQILRTSLALSLLTGQPFKLRRIRANREPKPGLRPQHLASVRAAATIGKATVTGDAVGSSQLTFHPGPVKRGKYRFDIGTAGSTSLVLHTVYLPLALAGGESDLTIEGGTHNEKAPSFHFNQTTWSAHLNRIGIDVKLKLVRPGFYPRGGGQVETVIVPTKRIDPIGRLGPLDASATRVLAFTAGLPDHVADRMARRAEVRLVDAGIAVETSAEILPGGPGAALLVTLPGTVPTLFCGLGERGKPAEVVADDAVDEALAHRATGMQVDPHSADQLLMPLALANGESTFTVSEVTRHLTTNADVIRLFLDREIAITGDEGSPGTVRVVGRGL